MRTALALAFLLVVSAAQAETNQERVRRWFERPAPTATPLPPVKPVEIKRQAPPQSTAPDRRPSSSVEQAKPKKKAKTKRKLTVPPPTRTTNANDPDYISCADARRGVTMSCFELVGYSGIYNRYSEKKKANARACLTAAEQLRIKSCFPS